MVRASQVARDLFRIRNIDFNQYLISRAGKRDENPNDFILIDERFLFVENSDRKEKDFSSVWRVIAAPDENKWRLKNFETEEFLVLTNFRKVDPDDFGIFAITKNVSDDSPMSELIFVN
jgi:hypothetical protein